MNLHFENLNVYYCILAVLGMIIHMLFKILAQDNEIKKQSRKQITINVTLAVLSTLALLLMADDLAELMGLVVKEDAPAKSIGAFTSGYLNHSLIRNLMNARKKKSALLDENAPNS